MTITAKDLAHFELLQGLKDSERGLFAKHIREKKFHTEKVIFHEGDKGGTIYFLVEGEVEISQALTLPTSIQSEYDTREKSIIRLSGEHGPVFGEVSLFGHEEKRTATVTATSDCRVGLLPAKDFFQILNTDHGIGYKVMTNLTRVLCGRLITANTNVLKLTTALSLVLER